MTEKPSYFPFVSVIVPALNEEENIGRCLQSLFRLTYPQDKIEVIVVDNGSVDSTIAVARSCGARVIDCGGRIGAVRNAGVRVARGHIFAFIDADCVAPSEWATAAVKKLSSKDIGIVGGISLVDPEQSNWVERAWVLTPLLREEDVKHIATASFIVRKDVFERAGGFNENVVSGEDMDLSARIHRLGYRLKLLPECAVYHYGYPKTLYGFFRRQVWHASSYLLTMHNKKNPVFLLTHVYALALILLVPELLLKHGIYTLVNLFIVFSVPVAASVYKFWKNKSHYSILIFFQSCIIMLFYFMGRSVGLCFAYFDIMTRLFRNKLED